MTTLKKAVSDLEEVADDFHFSPPVPHAKIQNILVTIDFSDCSESALRYAASLAENLGASLALVHVARPEIGPEDLAAGFTIAEVESRCFKEQREKLETLVRNISESVPETVVVTKGIVWDRIVSLARSLNSDLIVMGKHGSTLRHCFLGSTADRVVRHAPCPVLVVPGPT